MRAAPPEDKTDALAAWQARQDEIASWAGVAKNPENFDLKRLDLRALHDGSADALHSRMDVLDLPVRLRLRAGLRRPGVWPARSARAATRMGG